MVNTLKPKTNMELLEDLVKDIEKELRQHTRQNLQIKIELQKINKNIKDIAKLNDTDIQELIENWMI